jgi:hypothetical protein
MSVNRFLAKACFVLLAGVLLLGCAAAYLEDYTPRNPQEQAIKSVLTGFETAWNNQDEEALLALLDDDFILWVWSGGNRRIVFRKGTLGFKLRDIFIDWRYLGLGTPEILVKSNQATAYVPLWLDGRGYRSTFSFLHRDNTWVILDWEF